MAQECDQCDLLLLGTTGRTNNCRGQLVPPHLDLPRLVTVDRTVHTDRTFYGDPGCVVIELQK